jgi:hypothetical protein
MPTPAEIISRASSLQNDTAQQEYTAENVLPYFNMALDMLQEEFELNDIPVVFEESATLTVPASTTKIAFEGTIPTLPSNLIEIKAIYESLNGQNVWVGPLTKQLFISPAMSNPQVTNFGIWAWVDNAIQVPSSTQINDLRLDYIKSIFADVGINAIDIELGVRFKNCKSYLSFTTAALCSMFIGENETRAAVLSGQAAAALSRSMGISVKGKQGISIRRRPFRASYKSSRRASLI